MKKTLSAMIVVGMLISAVPSSYAGEAPLYLNQKLDEMTINAEKLETLETTHMLSNAFSFLSNRFKAAGKMVSSFFESTKTQDNDEDICVDSCKKVRKSCREAHEAWEEVMAMNATILERLDETIAMNATILERLDETVAMNATILAELDKELAEIDKAKVAIHATWAWLDKQMEKINRLHKES
jgi:hypothetical protein